MSPLRLVSLSQQRLQWLSLLPLHLVSLTQPLSLSPLQLQLQLVSLKALAWAIRCSQPLKYRPGPSRTRYLADPRLRRIGSKRYGQPIDSRCRDSR